MHDIIRLRKTIVPQFFKEMKIQCMLEKWKYPYKNSIEKYFGYSIPYWQIKDLARVNKFNCIRCLIVFKTSFEILNVDINIKSLTQHFSSSLSNVMLWLIRMIYTP